MYRYNNHKKFSFSKSLVTFSKNRRSRPMSGFL